MTGVGVMLCRAALWIPSTAVSALGALVPGVCWPFGTSFSLFRSFVLPSDSNAGLVSLLRCGLAASSDTADIIPATLGEYEQIFWSPIFVFLIKNFFRLRLAMMRWWRRHAHHFSFMLRVPYIEQILQQVISHEGVQQVVILGSGYDTRGYRFNFGDLLHFPLDANRLHRERSISRSTHPAVRFLEIDEPRTQRAKLKAMQSHTQPQRFAELIQGVTFAECDFEKPNALNVCLSNCRNFDPRLSTLFIWEGVTIYLTPDAVHNTLETLTSIYSTAWGPLTDIRPSIDGAGHQERIITSTSATATKHHNRGGQLTESGPAPVSPAQDALLHLPPHNEFKTPSPSPLSNVFDFYSGKEYFNTTTHTAAAGNPAWLREQQKQATGPQAPHQGSFKREPSDECPIPSDEIPSISEQSSQKDDAVPVENRTIAGGCYKDGPPGDQLPLPPIGRKWFIVFDFIKKDAVWSSGGLALIWRMTVMKLADLLGTPLKTGFSKSIEENNKYLEQLGIRCYRLKMLEDLERQALGSASKMTAGLDYGLMECTWEDL